MKNNWLCIFPGVQQITNSYTETGVETSLFTTSDMQGCQLHIVLYFATIDGNTEQPSQPSGT